MNSKEEKLDSVCRPVISRFLNVSGMKEEEEVKKNKQKRKLKINNKFVFPFLINLNYSLNTEDIKMNLNRSFFIIIVILTTRGCSRINSIAPSPHHPTPHQIRPDQSFSSLFFCSCGAFPKQTLGRCALS